MTSTTAESTQEPRRPVLGNGELLLFAITVFTSAFLLFQVQPLISRFILPWFGGSPAVWNTCMLFFQVVLFGGYVYAHLLTKLKPAHQAAVHCLLLLLACVLLPITPDDRWKPQTPDHPTLQIVGLLSISVGLPYFVLATTGPLLQSWFSRRSNSASPYRLYALSNTGSLLALVSYPFVVEPSLSSPLQAGVWSWCFAGFGLLCAACAITASRGSDALPSEQRMAADNAETHETKPSTADRLQWVALALIPSVMLLATTNQVCLDVAAIPFLWILPLSLYLLSFILCFDSDQWYRRRTYLTLLPVSLVIATTLLMSGSRSSIVMQVAAFLLALFFCCMVCHGELSRLKPGPRHLTSFYLLISAGGAGGGLFTGLLAPVAFPSFWELHIAIAACLIVTLVVLFRDRTCSLYQGRPRVVWLLMLSGVCGLAWSLQKHARADVESSLEVSRNFYGVLRIEDDIEPNPDFSFRSMLHGRIMHGMQFTSKSRRHIPTAYYGYQSGVGLTLRQHHPDQPRHIGVIGLGVGTLATYGTAQDTLRLYEINPEVVRLANRHFTFLSDCRSASETLLGDARLVLDREEPQQFDVLVLDAFSSDSIPTHLLTREAGELYLKHLKPDGILCVHISNLHFDLRSVVQGLAVPEQLSVAYVVGRERELELNLASHWMLLSRRPIPSTILESADHVGELTSQPLEWTDSYSDLLSVLR